MGASGVSCMLPVCISPAAPGSDSEVLADEDSAIVCIGRPAELFPGRVSAPAWLKRHHKTDAAMASTMVVVSEIQNARRYLSCSVWSIFDPSSAFVMKSRSFMAHPPP